MRALLLTVGVSVLLAGCGRKSPPVAVNSAPPKPRESQPAFPTPSPRDTPKEDDDKKLADFGGGPPRDILPPVVVAPPRTEEPKPPVGEGEKPVAPPMPPVPPKETLPPQRIIELEPRPTQPPPVARRPVVEQEMKDIHLFIDTNSLASGKMPPPALTYAVLGAAGSSAAKLVASGDIVLTNAPQRESCWAYQKGATTDGGWIVTNNGAEQVDAATAKRWLGGR